MANDVSWLHAFVLVALLRFCLCQDGMRLNISLPDYVDLYKPMDYAVIGQQKCGTSTLWNVMTRSPFIKWVSKKKETFYFQGPAGKTLCDHDVAGYQALVAVQRDTFGNQRVRYRTANGDFVLYEVPYDQLRVGDWSTSHLSCLCCPLSLKSLNPKMKLIVVLRDPIQRFISRFHEQQSSRSLPYNRMVRDRTLP
ncbi:hypothetical protein Agub_g6758, partial [Astrephomene gubernaculifera]